MLRARFFNFDEDLNKDYTADRFKDIKQINYRKSVILLRVLDRNIINRGGILLSKTMRRTCN